MKKLIISVMILACVSCASKPIPPTPVIVEDPLVPLTAELFSRLQAQVKNDGFAQLQFFISGPFILENYSTDKESLSIAGDKIIINGGSNTRRVIVFDKTAGTGSLYKSTDGRVAVKITIDKDPQKTLYFAVGTYEMQEEKLYFKESDSPDALLYLCASPAPQQYVIYGKETYTVRWSGKYPPFLLVKLDNKYTSPSTQSNASGDWLTQLMVGTYRARINGKAYYMVLKAAGGDSNKARLFYNDGGSVALYDEKGKKLTEGKFVIEHTEQQPEDEGKISIQFSNAVKAVIPVTNTSYSFTKENPGRFSDRVTSWVLMPPPR
jgi:hypothetical protein